MRSFRLLVLLAIASPCPAQWYDFQPVATVGKFYWGSGLAGSEVKIDFNDQSQVLYKVYLSETSSDGAFGIYLDDTLVYQSSSEIYLGELNNEGQFTFATDDLKLYRGDPDGVIVEYPQVGKEIQTSCHDPLGGWFNTPRLQDDATVFVTAYSGPRRFNIELNHGCSGSIYRVTENEVTKVLTQAIPEYFWDSNNLGYVAVPGNLIKPADSMESFDSGGYRYVSLNDHGDSVSVRFERRPSGAREYFIGHFEIGGGSTDYSVGELIGSPSPLIVNNQRLVAYGHHFEERVSILDLETGEIEHVFTEEDRLFRPTLHDFNNLGQLLLGTSDGFFVATPIDEPNGDLTFDGLVNAADIDRLSTSIIAGSDRRLFDMNQDNSITAADRDFLLSDILNVVPGDVDLDGDVEFDDFLALSGNFLQEGGWEQGNFDGLGRVDFADFLLLSHSYQTLQTKTVPESDNNLYLLLLGGLLFARAKFPIPRIGN